MILAKILFKQYYSRLLLLLLMHTDLIIFVVRENNCLKIVHPRAITNLAISFLFSQIMLGRKLQNVRLTFQNVFESNEEKMI